MRVIKFGGTSVGTVERFRNVINIISERSTKDTIIVVISAIGGITNKLISAIDCAKKGNKDYRHILEEITKIHYDFLGQLVTNGSYEITKNVIDLILEELEETLKGIYLLKEFSPRVSDSIVSIGEYLSKSILVSALNSNGISAENYDAVDLIKTNSNFGEAEVDFDLTNRLICQKIKYKKTGLNSSHKWFYRF